MAEKRVIREFGDRLRFQLQIRIAADIKFEKLALGELAESFDECQIGDFIVGQSDSLDELDRLEFNDVLLSLEWPLLAFRDRRQVSSDIIVVPVETGAIKSFGSVVVLTGSEDGISLRIVILLPKICVQFREA